jgi:hypothetical protein
VSVIALEMGGIVRSLRPAEAGRAGDPDGADRRADRDRIAGRDRGAGGRRPRQCRAVLDRPRAFRKAGSQGDLLRRLQAHAATATRWRRSRRPPMSSSGAATRRRAFTPTRPQDKTFVGNIVEAMKPPTPRAQLGAQPVPLQRCRPHPRHRLRPHDERGARWRGMRRAEAVPEARAYAPLAPSTRPCSA